MSMTICVLAILIFRVSALALVHDHKVYRNSKYLQSNVWRALTREEQTVVICLNADDWNLFYIQLTRQLINTFTI